MIFVSTIRAQNNTIDISGEWEVLLDSENELVKKHPGKCTLKGFINLPGSLAENGFGYKTSGSDFGILTPEYKYIGKAWYTKTIQIPQSWGNKKILIFLERVLWESRIFIDGNELTKQDALGTPHIHKLGNISPGTHKLVIQVNNEMIHNIGDKGHAYGENTQSIWNGIVGRMEIIAKDQTHFKSVNIYPDIQNEMLVLKSEIFSENNIKAEIYYEIISHTTKKTVLSGNVSEEISAGTTNSQWEIQTNGKLKKWSEFNPEVYILKLSLKAKNYQDNVEKEFGFYQLSHDKTKILINGIPVFLRGNLDCVHFPETGYVSCKLDDWINIFKTYKEYGLNHARFHSWCPPEAAFKAANRVGIYLQAEASIWIDWWMSTDMVERGRPEMDTKGHPKGLGYDVKRDSFVIAEMNRVVETYGNHPSFVLFCIGNELGNSDFSVMKKWVADLKQKDSRRLYSVSTAREITEVDDFMATHYIKNVGRTRGLNGAATDWNFEKVYGQMNIPIIAHEIGQWPVYPKWTEIEKYTGVLKARNLQKFKLQAQKNCIANQDIDFVKASGALNQIMYKYEIESFLRTKSCAGIQLLSMQDYQGQGEALIGWLDCHWESKGITTPEKFRQHFNLTVPLLLTKKFVWENDEVFSAKVQVSHHSLENIYAKGVWSIFDESQNEIASGDFDEIILENGNLTDVGEINFALNEIAKAQRLTVSISVLNTSFKNEWNIWVYPKNLPESKIEETVIINQLDSNTIEKLVKGAKVLLQANQLGTEETSVKALFYPLYWSLTFFPGQGKTNIGLLINQRHKAFNYFPTSFHSDWQWESVSSDAKGFILNDLSPDFKPIAQPIDDFHRNNKIGSIFELKVGKGNLLVCGYNLNSGNPVARQLKYSLLEYINSSGFNPVQSVEVEWLKEIFKYIPKAEKAEIPKEFENAIFIVDAAKNIQSNEENVQWNSKTDDVELAENVTYRIKADGCWKDKNISAWQGKEMNLQINCPEGITGTLLVNFNDWNNNGRTGILDFEGRKSKLDLHRGNEVWIKFHVMREDSNDGKLVLKTIAETGPNLMISKVVLLQE